ncbi:MAG TPA: phasin family protein [Candidatus Binatia bacterium]|nr:phasin family protein [Candidatus Binatia bacterium]
MEENKMANPRDDKSTQNIEDTARHASERATEQTTRMGQVAAEAGDEVARVGAQLLQQNAETVQNAWRFGLDMATKVMGRSTEELGRTLGFSGNEAQQAQQATERSARNTETILYSSTAATRLMSGMSQEYFEFVRQQMEKSMERMNELWRCRTPQDLAAVQSDLLRETVGSVLQSSRKMADMSLKVADDATKHMERFRPAA